MKKILIISLFLFGQQAFSEVIPSDQLTGIYKNQGKTDTYIDNKIENKLVSVNNIIIFPLLISKTPFMAYSTSSLVLFQFNVKSPNGLALVAEERISIFILTLIIKIKVKQILI
jgi:hypothetical protein